jgi:hypothetical protein
MERVLVRPFFKDDAFSFLTEIALGATYHQAADVGEVLSAVERIRSGHSRSWVDEWTATADRLAAEASQAGYWVPRSVAFEQRIAAAVADPGVVDVSATMTGQVPHFLVKMLEAGEQEKFDKDMALALRFSPATRSMMAFRMRPYGTTSPYEFFTAARGYALTDEVIGQITCPVLVTDPDHEQFWPGQSRELYDKLPAGKALIRFTAEEGAYSHCEPAGNGLRGERIFDWLDQHIPA